MKRRIAISIALVMLLGMALPVIAAGKDDAQMRADFSIVIDGKETTFARADGQAVYPILYEGTTYLPLRAIGEIMGKNVNWDETTKTVTISGARQTTTTAPKKTSTGITNISVEERNDFNIVIEGVKQKFQTTDGQALYPVLYDGSTYLPLRAIGQIMGKEVVWNSTAKTITLSADGKTVTDADSFGTSKNTTNTTTTNDIGVAKAKEIALAHAGLKEKDVSFVNAKLDRDDGKKIYEVEFYSGTVEYDYDIDAVSGEILSYDKDIENFATTAQSSAGAIDLAKAKSIALNHAGLKESDVTFTTTKADRDDGVDIYDVEFRSGRVEYEYEINASTGVIISYDKDND